MTIQIKNVIGLLKKWGLILLFLSHITSCGQMGHLYLPDQQEQKNANSSALY